MDSDPQNNFDSRNDSKQSSAIPKPFRSIRNDQVCLWKHPQFTSFPHFCWPKYRHLDSAGCYHIRQQLRPFSTVFLRCENQPAIRSLDFIRRHRNDSEELTSKCLARDIDASCGQLTRGLHSSVSVIAPAHQCPWTTLPHIGTPCSLAQNQPQFGTICGTICLRLDRTLRGRHRLSL